MLINYLGGNMCALSCNENHLVMASKAKKFFMFSLPKISEEMKKSLEHSVKTISLNSNSTRMCILSNESNLYLYEIFNRATEMRLLKLPENFGQVSQVKWNDSVEDIFTVLVGHTLFILKSNQVLQRLDCPGCLSLLNISFF